MIRPILALTVAILMCGASVDGQWINHPTPGAPRTADGKVNLAAPAPRTQDGRPDLSGVWKLEGTCPADGCDDYEVAPEVR